MDLVRENEIEARVSANQEQPNNNPFHHPFFFCNFSVVLGESNMQATLQLQVIEKKNKRNLVCVRNSVSQPEISNADPSRLEKGAG